MGESITCNYNKNFCRFSKSCENVVLPQNREFRVQLRGGDNTVGHDIFIPLRDLLVEGRDFGDGSDKCYFAMFRSESGFVNTWQLGTVVMKKYYIVYDMSSYDKGKDYL